MRIIIQVYSMNFEKGGVLVAISQHYDDAIIGDEYAMLKVLNEGAKVDKNVLI